MHRITELYWRADRVEHIARHNVTLEEFEEALFDDPDGILKFAQRASSNPEYKIYKLLGRTRAGRYLFLVLMYYGRGSALPVAARDMESGEKRTYRSRVR